MKEGCSSVVEFAKKIGGVSEEQVSRVLNVHKKFTSTPELQHLLTSGAVSVNKLARVASIALPENEEILVNQVQLLSQSALETFVRDVRTHTLARASLGDKPEYKQELPQEPLRLDEDVEQALKNLQRKGININEELRLFLEQRKQAIEEEKNQIAQKLATQEKPQTRYLPARVQKVIKKEYGNICSRSGCSKPAADIHHEKRWRVDPTNDPRYLSPLCEEHHEIAHTIDVKYQERKRRR